MVSRNGIAGGRVSSSSLYCPAIFSRIAFRCISPSLRMTVSLACGLCSMRKHGSSAAILCNTSATFCSSRRFFGVTASPNTEAGSSRPRVQMRILGGVVKDVVELDLLDAGDGDDVTGQRFLYFGLRLSAQHEEVPGLDGLPPFTDVELHVG